MNQWLKKKNLNVWHCDIEDDNAWKRARINKMNLENHNVIMCINNICYSLSALDCILVKFFIFIIICHGQEIWVMKMRVIILNKLLIIHYVYVYEWSIWRAGWFWGCVGLLLVYLVGRFFFGVFYCKRKDIFY